MKKKLFLIILVVVILVISLVLFNKDNNDFDNTITYKGKEYVLLEYNMDIFTYDFNSNKYYEEDIIHPVKHDKWDIVYYDGDLFVLDKQVKEATKYYSDDKNYEWFIIFYEEESEIMLPLSISKEELKYLYNMENIEKKETMTFDEIKQFADIVKVSKDEFLKASINLVHYEEDWYWKTEIMNNNDEEYIIKVVDSLNQKIFKLREN